MRLTRVRSAERRFRLVDIGLLVAATAVGLTLLRLALSPAPGVNIVFRGRWPWLESSIFHGLMYGTPVLLAWSVATLVLSLWHPRPHVHRLARCPGFVANAAAVAGATFIGLHYLGQAAIDPGLPGRSMHVVSTGLPGDVGYFVAGSWVALALRGRFRPCPTWTDRLGWALGVAWVGMAMLTWSRLYLLLLK